jgi:hypothetical protein
MRSLFRRAKTPAIHKRKLSHDLHHIVEMKLARGLWRNRGALK